MTGLWTRRYLEQQLLTVLSGRAGVCGGGTQAEARGPVMHPPVFVAQQLCVAWRMPLGLAF
jgi:hypothetical protein